MPVLYINILEINDLRKHTGYSGEKFHVLQKHRTKSCAKTGVKVLCECLHRNENSLKIAGRISLMLLKPSLRETQMENCRNHSTCKFLRRRSFETEGPGRRYQPQKVPPISRNQTRRISHDQSTEGTRHGSTAPNWINFRKN